MHLANGDIDVQRSVLPPGTAGVDETVARMQEMAKGEYGAKSAKIRALAINVINRAGIGDKDYYGMAKAIHNWVRDEIRYVKDPVGQETLSYPEETAFNSHAGDCLHEDTRLLTPTGYVRIADVKAGDVIQGKLGWTRVRKVWDKGDLPVSAYEADNGGVFLATEDHRCFLLDGSEKRAGDLRVGDALLGPSPIELPATRADDWTDADFFFIGLYLADGWSEGKKTCISGKDGFAKEEQKRWVLDYAEARGWRTHWHARYVTVYIPREHALFALLHDGRLAPEKRIPKEILAALTPSRAERLLTGLLSDSYSPLTSKRAIGAEKGRKHQVRSGLCYTTTSPELKDQIRLLFRLAGFGMSAKLVIDHGGLGTHPVYRCYPRYYRPKPARVRSVTPAGIAHVWDLETEDHGIYLPDADVVVHNCDDKTILEIALLGSIGIRAYPVVIGVRPGHYSHVYLHVEIPQGGRPGRHAGETLPADPIMREWEFGREAPAEKIAQKKTYEDLAGLGDLPPRRRRGTMPARNTTMSLGSYVAAPSYLDVHNVSSVAPAMRAALVDTAGRGEILNAPKVNEHNTDEVDTMFDAGAVSVFKSAPNWDIAPYGPITGAEASGTVDPLKVRTYETAFGRKSFASNRRTKVVDVPTRALPGTASDGVMVDHVNASDDSVSGLGQIAEYINSIMGEGLSGKPEKTVAAAYLAHRRAATRKAKLTARAGFLPGMGDEHADFIPGMGDVVVAKKAATDTVRLAAAVAPKRVVRAARALTRLDSAGVVGRIEAQRIPTAHKVVLLTRALYQELRRPRMPAVGDAQANVSIQGPLYTRLPAGGRVQAHAGALAEDIEGLGKNIFERASDFVKQSDVFSASALKNLVGSAKQFTKTPFKTLAKGGMRVAAFTPALPVIAAAGLVAPLGIAPLKKLNTLTWGSPRGVTAPLGKALSGPMYRPVPANPPQALPDTPIVPVGPAQPVVDQTPYIPDQAIPNEQTYYPQQQYYPTQGQGYDPSAYSAWGSAPPVDTFGPQDMGPAQWAESAGSAQVFTTEMNAEGDQAPAQWSGGDAPMDEDGGERPEIFMDEEDDESEGAAPAPRRRVRRRVRREPVEIDEADDAYLVEDDTDAGGSEADADVAGLGALSEQEVEARARAAYEKLDDKKNPYSNPVTRQYWREAVIAWDGGTVATAEFQKRWAKRAAGDAAIRELEALVAKDTTPEIIPGSSKTDILGPGDRLPPGFSAKKPNYTVPVIVGVLGLATVLFLANRK
jgi:hypothetical protein